MFKCRDEEKTKQNSEIWKKSHVWYWYRKLCSNCWSLHLFGIEMIMEGVPWKSVKFFLGTNQFYLSVNIKLSGEEKTKQISEKWKNQTCAVLMWSLYEIIHIWTAVVDESEEWSLQLIFQFKQLERRSLKKSGLQRDLNPWPPRYRCDALPTELWSHTLGVTSINWVHIFPWGVKWCEVYMK